MRIRGCSSKPRGVREQNSLRNSALREMFTTKRRSTLKREEKKLNIEKIFVRFSQNNFMFTKSRNFRRGGMHRRIGVWNKQNILTALMMILAGFYETSVTHSLSIQQ